MRLNCWMKDIDDREQVLGLNIVGTHDCVTRFVQFSHISKCQDKSIAEQLELGIRALDIRVKSSKDRLKMVHGAAKALLSPNPFSAQMDMEDVLTQCYEFLRKNPSETMIFQFKNDSNRENEKCFDNLFRTYIKGFEDKWFLENRSPSMREARGKIVLIRRCKMADRKEYTHLNTGIDFSKWIEQDTAENRPLTLKTSGENEMLFIIQDRFKYKPVPRWNEVIKPFLDTMTPFDGRYVINYLSTAGGFKGPYKNAQYINPKFMEYPLKKGYYYGTIYTDFPDEKLVRKIIGLNFE